MLRISAIAPTATRSIPWGTALTDRAATGILDLEPVAGAAPAALDIARIALPPRLRPAASVGVLDITEFFGDTTGGVRTYLLEKAQYVQRHPTLRQVLVVPGARDEILEAGGVRCYRLHGPYIPTQKPYRFMLATRSTSRIVAHERPDLIEVGSAWCAPWLVHLATRQLRVPAVWFYHSNFPRVIAPRPRDAGWARRTATDLAWRYVRRLGRMVEATIAPCRALAAELSEAGLRNVTHVPLGVNLERFTPARRAHAADTRHRFGLDERPFALYVGRMAMEKDLDVLLDAWPEVERRTGVRLVLVGMGPARRRLMRSRGGQRALWLPYEADRDRLADLYAAAELVVARRVPSRPSVWPRSSRSRAACRCSPPTVAGWRRRWSAPAGAVTSSRGIRASLVETAVAMLQGDLAALGAAGRASTRRRTTAGTAVFDRLFEVYRRVLRR